MKDPVMIVGVAFVIAVAVLSAVLLWPERQAWRWIGVTGAGAMHCPMQSADDMRCVAGGRVFLCVRSWRDRTVECAPWEGIRP